MSKCASSVLQTGSVVTQSGLADANAQIQQLQRELEALRHADREADRLRSELQTVRQQANAAADALPWIMANVGVPLVADIHYDHKLALASLEARAILEPSLVTVREDAPAEQTLRTTRDGSVRSV